MMESQILGILFSWKCINRTVHLIYHIKCSSNKSYYSLILTFVKHLPNFTAVKVHHTKLVISKYLR